MTIKLNIGLTTHSTGFQHWSSTSVPAPDREGGFEIAPIGAMWFIAVSRLKSENSTTALNFEFVPEKYDAQVRKNDLGEDKVFHRITFRSDYLVEGDVQEIPVRFTALGFVVEGWLILTF